MMLQTTFILIIILDNLSAFLPPQPPSYPLLSSHHKYIYTKGYRPHQLISLQPKPSSIYYPPQILGKIMSCHVFLDLSVDMQTCQLFLYLQGAPKSTVYLFFYILITWVGVDGLIIRIILCFLYNPSQNTLLPKSIGLCHCFSPPS